MPVHVRKVAVVKNVPRQQKRAKKVCYTQDDLPFPAQGRTFYMKNWEKYFKPTLLHCAGTIKDPWGTNCVLEVDDVVENAWKEIYPDLMETLGNTEHKAAVMGVVRVFDSGFFDSFTHMHPRPRPFSTAGAARSEKKL